MLKIFGGEDFTKEMFDLSISQKGGGGQHLLILCHVC